jgi:hypothetical protein
MSRPAASIALLVLFLATTASASDRSVTVRTTAGTQRIEIANPTDRDITFTLGLNDQLFENKEALLASVRSSPSQACRHLREGSELALPCAAFERVASAIVHFPELTDQFYDNGFSGYPRLWAESPLLAINSFGFGTCGTFADVLAKVWHELGYEVRRRELNGHTLTEVKVNGRWRVFDADLRGFVVHHRKIIGVDELMEHPELIGSKYALRPLPGRREKDFPHSGMKFYPALMKSSKQPPWNAVKEIPIGPDDWRELTFTIPAHGRLVLPEAAGDDCLYPENASAPFGGGRTDAPHQFAVVEMPAGAKATMRSGLFVGQITGNFCVTAEYLQDTDRDAAFDQLHTFRYARRFARSVSIEAESQVAVYYLLSANVALRKDNEVRLHGDGVDGLRVGLIDEHHGGVEPRMPPRTCIADDGFDHIEVKSAWASSYSYGNQQLRTYLIDGQPGSGWISDMLETNTPQSIVLDLGQPQVVSGVRWSPNAQYGMLSPSAIEIDMSLDGNHFHEADCVTDYAPGRVEWMERRFEPRATRYVRLMLTPVHHFIDKERYQISLGDIEILR